MDEPSVQSKETDGALMYADKLQERRIKEKARDWKQLRKVKHSSKITPNE